MNLREITEAAITAAAEVSEVSFALLHAKQHILFLERKLEAAKGAAAEAAEAAENAIMAAYND